MGDEASIRVHRRAELEVRAVPRIVGRQRFGVAQHRLDRAAGRLGQEIAQQLVVDLALAAEVAPDVVGIHVDVSLAEPGDRDQLIAQSKRHFVGAHHVHDVLFVDPQQAGRRLDEALVLPWRRKRMLEHTLRLSKDRLDVGIVLVDDLRPLHIRVTARGTRAGAEERIRVTRRVQDRRIVAQRLQSIEDGWQLLVLDLNRPDGSFGHRRCVGGHDRQSIADEAYAVHRQ